MEVVIDIDRNGMEHYIETDPGNAPPVHHPDGTGLTGVDQMLIHHNDHPDDREAGGWHIKNQLPGESEPLTRWQRLVRATNGPDATEQAKSLGLHE